MGAVPAKIFNNFMGRGEDFGRGEPEFQEIHRI
jgi:hypothetical protein